MADFWIDVKKVPLAELDVAGYAARRQRNSAREFNRMPPSIWIASQQPLNGMVLSLPDRQRPIINDIVLLRGQLLHRPRRNEVHRQRHVRPRSRICTPASGFICS